MFGSLTKSRGPSRRVRQILERDGNTDKFRDNTVRRLVVEPEPNGGFAVSDLGKAVATGEQGNGWNISTRTTA
jgi:hypothetical protein